jgi:hypothetical protein
MTVRRRPLLDLDQEELMVVQTAPGMLRIRRATTLITRMTRREAKRADLPK